MAHNSEQSDNHVYGGEAIPVNEWGGCKCISAEELRERVSKIKSEIAPCNPKIIGVTKYYGIDSIVSGYEAGLRDFGESRAADAVEKIVSLPDEVRMNSTFHFIGHLQTNKVRKVVEYFDFIHSVDSLKLAKIISEVSSLSGKKIKILLQVNNAKEEQKFGYNKESLIADMPELIKLTGIEIVGLMNMAVRYAEKDELISLFGDLREFKDSLEREFGIHLYELSMGMSDDYIYAVKEGATMIRLGRKLFS